MQIKSVLYDLVQKLKVNVTLILLKESVIENHTETSSQDSTGHIGFQFKDGKITSIVVDSSAARSGPL